jgi:hypothetical protein
MKTFKAPNLNAPRFRPKKLVLLHKQFCKELIKKYPQLKYLTEEQIKKLIISHNQKIWNTVIENRDGVELPKQLGYLFIGTCPRKVKPNIDFKRSKEYGSRVQFQNWESDQYLAKIFYTNYETKYKFAHHELWQFSAVRQFSRKVGQVYPQEWKKYVVVDNHVNIHRYYRMHKRIDRQKIENNKALETYNEFDIQ